MKVVVVGAGVGGLASALALGRRGHEITIVEGDHTPMPADAEGAFAWDRTGAPQVRHSHVLLARLRNLLRDEYPDVLQAMFDAGMEERSMLDDLPDTIDDAEPRPGDEDLVILAARRTTFEWVLRSVVLAEPHVRMLDGVRVRGLEMTDGVIVGVQTGDGVLEADLVVAANGRRSDLGAWARAVDVELDEESGQSGIVYLSRFYRRATGAGRPAGPGFGTADLGYLKAGLFPCDNDTISITLATAADDAELRKRLADGGTYDRAARLLPTLAPWLLDGDVEPISDVEYMAGLINRRRCFVRDGEPVLPGFAAVGDAHTVTNPIYGRGCSLAFVMATELAEACEQHPDDPIARGLAYEAAVEREVGPWYRASVMADEMAKANGNEMNRGGTFGPVLGTALRTDATLLRAFIRMLNLLAPPESFMGDPDLLQRFQAASQREPIAIDMGPKSRTEFLAALDA